MDEVDPEIRDTFNKLGIPLIEQQLLAGVAVDAVFDSVSVATTFREKLRQARHHLLFVLRSRARNIPSWSRSTGIGSAAHRQLLRRARTPRSSATARFVYIPKGREVPDGAVDLLPHQRQEHPGSSSAR